MPISTSLFNTLLESNACSWALWSSRFGEKDSLETDLKAIEGFLRQEVGRLKPNVVFLGLNRSHSRRKAAKTIPPHPVKCSNFHNPRHRGDAFLCKEISGCLELLGGFMTDLSMVLESNSKKVGEPSIEDVANFRSTLKKLRGRPIHVICFGHRVFNALTRHLETADVGSLCQGDVPVLDWHAGREWIRAYRVIHYSYAVRYNRAPRFRKQLRCINQAVRNCQ